MFGIGDNQHQTNDDPVMLDNVKQLVNDHSATDDSTQSQTASPAAPVPTPTPFVTSNDNTSDANNAHAEPAQGFSSSPLPDKPAPEEETEKKEENTEAEENTDDNDYPESVEEPIVPAVPEEPAKEDDSATPAVSENVNAERLASLKQEALGHLEPLVEHLGGSPEEVFRTTMMMIQANDNHKLIEKALEAAKKIEDDSVRAKAMLDIINEINYFSQGSKVK